MICFLFYQIYTSIGPRDMIVCGYGAKKDLENTECGMGV